MSTPMVITQAKPRAKPKFTAPRKVLINRLRIVQFAAAQKSGHGAASAGHASTSGIGTSRFQKTIWGSRREAHVDLTRICDARSVRASIAEIWKILHRITFF